MWWLGRMSMTAARWTRSGEAHAGGGAGAAVVHDDEEFAVAELLHDLDLVLRHRPEGIVDIIFAAVFGAYAVAIAPEIGSDHMKMLGKPRRDLMPGDMGQGIAVQQQQGRAVAAVPQMDSRAARHDLRPGETLEHPPPPSSALISKYQRLVVVPAQAGIPEPQRPALALDPAFAGVTGTTPLTPGGRLRQLAPSSRRWRKVNSRDTAGRSRVGGPPVRRRASKAVALRR